MDKEFQRTLLKDLIGKFLSKLYTKEWVSKMHQLLS